jgi:hypothetical protein
MATDHPPATFLERDSDCLEDGTVAHGPCLTCLLKKGALWQLDASQKISLEKLRRSMIVSM